VTVRRPGAQVPLLPSASVSGRAGP